MHRRSSWFAGLSGLWLMFAACHSGVAVSAADGPVRKATINYSAAPWDGAAYDLEIPLEPTAEASQPSLRINLWGNPEFTQSSTVSFSGREDAGGGPSRGSGRASYQAVLNKSWPQPLAGSIIFQTLQNDHLVSGRYELATLDGKRKFSGRFQATWGNAPMRAIR